MHRSVALSARCPICLLTNVYESRDSKALSDTDGAYPLALALPEWKPAIIRRALGPESSSRALAVALTLSILSTYSLFGEFTQMGVSLSEGFTQMGLFLSRGFHNIAKEAA